MHFIWIYVECNSSFPVALDNDKSHGRSTVFFKLVQTKNKKNKMYNVYGILKYVYNNVYT